jgi:uncharacterized protein (TIGR03083 family)
VTDVTVEQVEDLPRIATEARERIMSLVADLEPSVANASVPACPDWTVKDVIAHLTGVCADILAGNIEGVGTDPWTAAQVEARRDASLDALLEEWAAAAIQVEPLVPMFPGRSGRQWIADIASHEHDLRGALGASGAQDSEAVAVGTDFFVEAFLEYAAKKPLVIVAGDRTWGGDPDEREGIATLRARPFELLRSISGRRSLDQIRRLDWSEDPEPWLPSFEWGPFRPAATDIVE